MKFYKGLKALHGWDKVWGLAFCIVIFVIVELYKTGAFDGIISRIGKVLKKIDHAIDHSAKRPEDKEDKHDEAE